MGGGPAAGRDPSLGGCPLVGRDEPVRRGPLAPTSLTHGAVGRLVAALGAATLLQWLGAFAIAPILPLYLEERDVSASGVGVVMAAFFVGALAAQYPSGLVAGVRGHRPVLIAGLVAYAIGCVGLILSPGLTTDTAMRGLQGAGAGAFEVAVLTAVAATVPQDITGRAFSAVYSGQIAGIAIGPLLGGLAGEQRMDLLFLGSGVAAAVASVPVVILLRGDGPAGAGAAREGRRERVTGAAVSGAGPAGAAPPDRATRPAAGGGGRPWQRSRSRSRPVPRAGRWSRSGRLGPGAAGLLLVAAANGLAVGTYETCWSLLLTDRGVSTELIGLTFTLFSLPYIVFAMPAGWLADHGDRRWLVVGATGIMGLTVASYSFIGAFWLIVLVSCAEAIALAISFPSAQSLLAQESGSDGAGRAQGLFTTTQTAATATAALASGALYAANVHLPFVLTAIAAAAAAAALPYLWRGVRGVVARPEVTDAVGTATTPVASVPAVAGRWPTT